MSHEHLNTSLMSETKSRYAEAVKSLGRYSKKPVVKRMTTTDYKSLLEYVSTKGKKRGLSDEATKWMVKWIVSAQMSSAVTRRMSNLSTQYKVILDRRLNRLL